MKKALIVYQSKTGITKRFGEEINRYIAGKGVESQVIPVQNFKNEMAEKADYVLLGCWTAGFMLLFQHPDRPWIGFAKQLPELSGKKAALFTTYKIATGSMFKSMRKYLSGQALDLSLELKSRKGNLADEHKMMLDRFLES